MEKSYETGWEKHGETWRPPTTSLFDNMDPSTLRDLLMPPGMVEAYAGASPPAGWLLCQGQLVSRQTYRRLFDVIGTTYGAGDGSTTFGIPNLKGRVINGLDSAQTEFDTLGETGGSKSITTAAMPVHAHGVTIDANNFNTDHRNTNHAHNVYARNQDTGWCNQNWNHWHPAHIGNMHWNATQNHGHHDRAQIASEAPWEGANWAGTVPVNVETRDTNHTHNFNHDHPSTNYASESPWPGDYNHQHNANHGHTGSSSNTGGGSANGNLPPYLVLNYVIKT